MLLLLWAGAAKLASIPSFLGTLSVWSYIPEFLHPVIALAVPTLEAGIALAWFLDLGQSIAVRAALLLIGSFTALYVLHLLLSVRPTCGCLGFQVAFRSSQTEACYVLARNAVLGALLLTEAVRGAKIRPPSRSTNESAGAP